MKANTIEEYLGTLQQSMVESWKDHLKTDKYSKHKALNEFYDEIVELVDALIEEYQGLHGVVKDLKNVLSTDEISAVDYLKELRELAEDGKEKFFKDESELQSDVDSILSLIDSTLYKLKELDENKLEIKSLSDFVKESIEVDERRIWRTLEDCLTDHVTQAVIAAWDEVGLEFTHKELKDTLDKVAKEYDVDKHIDWAKEYMK